MIAGSIEIQLLANVARLQNDLDKATRSVGGAMGRIEKSVAGAQKAFGALGLGFGAAISLQGVIKAIDSVTKMEAQIANATKTQAEFNQALENTQRIAKVSQTDILAIGTTYARLSNALQDLGASQMQVSDVTETLALSLKVNGATGAETASVMLQLSQAFGKGKLDGDEFRSAMEAAPNVMRQLATSIGVPFGALKELAAAGQITSDVLLKAFTNPEYLKALQEQADRAKTTGGAWEVFTKQLVVAIAKINEATGASKILIGVLEKAATLLSIFEGGEKGSKLRNFLEPGNVLRKKQLEGMSVAQLKGLAGFQLDAKKALEERLSKASSPKFSGISIQSTIAPAFSSTIEAQDINKIHQAQEDKLTKIKQDATAATEALRKAENERKRKLEEHFNVLRAGVYAEHAYNESLKEVRNTIFAAVEAEQSRLDSTRREIDLLRIGEKAISDREVAEIRHTMAIGDSNSAFIQANYLQFENNGFVQAAIDALDEQNKAYEKLIGTKEANIEADLRLNSFKLDKEQADNRIKEAKRAQDDIEKEAKRSSDEIGNSLTDALLRGFESGKGFAKNFRDTLKNLFKTLILQPVIRFLVDSSGIKAVLGALGGIFSGGANASGGSVASAGGSGGIGGLFSSIKSFFGKSNASIIGAIEGFGATIANGLGGIRDTIGGFIGQNSGMIANVGAFAGAALSLLQGDLKGAAFQGAGAGIGLALGGPIGGAIGSFLGNIVGGLFGKKKAPRLSTLRKGKYDNGIFTASSNGQQYKPLGAQSSLDGLSEQFSRTLGTLFTGFGQNDKISTASSLFRKTKASYGNFSASFDGGSVSANTKGKAKNVQNTFARLVEEVLGSTIVQAIKKSKLSDGIKGLFEGLVKKEQVISMVNASVNLNTAQKQLAERFGITVDQTAKAAKGTSLIGDALAELVNKFANVANSTQTIGQVLVEAQNAILGVLGSSLNKITTLIVNAVTPLEQTFDAINSATLPATLKEFDALLAGINKSTATGLKQFTDLFLIRDQFIAFSQALDQLKGGVRGALFGIVSEAEKQQMLNADLAKLFGELGRAVPGSIQELIALGKSINFTTEEGLNLAAVFPSLVTAFNQTQNAVDSLINSLREADSFRTLVDLQRYQGVVSNYGNAFANNYVDNLPSFATGTNMLPSDMVANVHAGERIVPAADNQAIIQALNGSSEVKTLLRDLITEIRTVNIPLIQAAQKTAKVMQRIDDEGVQIRETNNAGVRTVLNTRVVA